MTPASRLPPRPAPRARARRARSRSCSTTLVVLFVLVYPTAWVIVASFKTPETMFSSERWEFTLQNYVRLLDAGFGRNIVNSLVLCLVSVAISTVLAVNAAYAFSRLRFRGQATGCSARCCSARPSRGSSWSRRSSSCARGSGCSTTLAAMIFVYVAVTLPFSIYLLVGYLRAVPREPRRGGDHRRRDPVPDHLADRLPDHAARHRRDRHLRLPALLVGVPVRARAA